MAQFLFVHGTSVRKEDYNQTIFVIEKQLKSMGHTVLPCIWGDNFGIPESGWGRSIPGFADDNPPPPDPDAALWILLFQDPFFRLRELIPADQSWSAFGGDPGDPLWQYFQNLVAPPELLAIIEDRGLTPYWQKNLAALKSNNDLQTILKALPVQPGEIAEDLARAVIASFLLTAMEAGAPALAAPAREEMVTLLAGDLGLEKGFFSRPISFLVRSLRNPTMKIFMKYAADVLLYQSRGEAIRTVVRNAIVNATGPVIVLAHSLGGVAAVDVLAAEDLRPKVTHLITAGSQAPFLYDANALHSLTQVKALPQHFPAKWLNIYDQSDLLSFLAEPAFSPARVTDFHNDTRLAPLAAHSAYWDSPEVWKRIEKFIQ